MIPSTVERVPQHTADHVNEEGRIREMAQRLKAERGESREGRMLDVEPAPEPSPDPRPPISGRP